MKHLKVQTKLQEIHPLHFLLHILLFQQIQLTNTSESSSDFMILIISFISSFEINEVNPFPALTDPFPRIFLSNLFIAFEIKLITDPIKLSLAKGIVMFTSAFFS